MLKIIRYSAASVVGVITGQSLLVGFHSGLGLPAVWSNVLAVTLGTIPNYLINRAWTFGKSGRHSVRREVLPFWIMAFLGLALSTVTVAWADQRYDGNAIAISLANMAAFGVLWVAKFFVLERVLFVPAITAETHTPPTHP